MLQQLIDRVGPSLAEHAEGTYPRECCGLVVRLAGDAGAIVYAPCANISPDDSGQDQFVISPEDWAQAEDRGEILAVCHSHPNESANPSQADLVMCERSGLPWIIVGWPSGVVRSCEPTGYQAPLVGREFFHGVLDCYTLVRDYYQRELDIELPDFEREDAWWDKGQNLYRDNFAAAGFVEVNEAEPRQHDALLMQVRSDVENHAAVYLGDQVILHHLYSRLSERTVYGGYWHRHTRAILRHKSLMGTP